ncbi:MAG: aldo/keto reductase, partial [Oceanobacter sp.]
MRDLNFLRFVVTDGHYWSVSIQNPYNLLNRSYEVGLAEVSIREQVGLLPYSPLGFGALTGKYRNGAKPEGARMTLFDRFQRYQGSVAEEAIEAYCKIAEAHGMTPATMALAFVNDRDFVTSNIIGATTMDQLKENIATASVVLSEQVIAEINEVHKRISNPCP